MLRRALDIFRGRAVTIPPMDGPLRPNTGLDDAAVVLEVPAPDNLTRRGGEVLVSSGASVLSVSPDGSGAAPRRLAEFAAPVTALAAAPDGGVAVGLDDGGIRLVGGRHDGQAFAGVGPDLLRCPTALAFLNSETLLVCQGSARCRPSDWALDLMEKNAAGSVWRLDLGSGAATSIAAGLAFPYGLLPGPDGAIVAAESWRHRLVRVRPDGRGRIEPILERLPAYPARLAPASDGGAWLCLFAPRNRLIEFVLQEDAYRAEMVADIDRDLWIAPALSGRRSFMEPLQCGSVRVMGVYKPWSPSRSYGLLVRLDPAFRPLASYHSRASGARHGVTSALEVDDVVLAASKGGNAVLRLDPAAPAGDWDR